MSTLDWIGEQAVGHGHFHVSFHLLTWTYNDHIAILETKE
jgi:hypothetical protein